MKRKMKRALSIVLMICLFATCSLYQFEIDVQAAETIGINAIWGDTNETATTFYVTEENQLRYQKNVLVTAVLPQENFKAGSKSIKITLADGLSWVDNGSVSTISNYFTHIEKLDDASAYPSTSESLNNGSYVYHVKDDVTSVTLNLVVQYDTKTHLTDLKNAITASYSYEDDSDTIQTGETTASAVISLEDSAAKQTGIKGPQKTTPGNFQMRIEDGNKFGVSSSYKTYWKEVSITVTVPSDITYSGDSQEGFDWTYTKTDNGDFSTYTFTITDKIAYQIFIDPIFTIPETYKHGDTFNITYEKAKVKYYDGTEETLTDVIPYKCMIDNALGVRLNSVSANVVNGSGINTIVNTINWTRTDTFHGVSDIYKDAEGVLGFYSLENASANTITDKVLTINFDNKNVKVNAVKLFGANSGEPLDVTVSYKTSENSAEQTEVITIDPSDFTKNDSSNDIGHYFLFTEKAGLGADAYLTKVSYTIPSIPGNARYAKYYYYGSISDYDALAKEDALATVQLTDNYNPSFKILAQSATELDTEAHNGILSYRHESNVTKTYTAGDTLSTKIRIYANSYGHSFTPTPVFYIRDETGLGIKNIKLSTYTALASAKTVVLLDTKNGKNPYGITVTELEREADGARVYKIDTTNVATSSNPYAAAIGLFDSSYANTFRTAQMVLQYDVVSTKAYFDNSTLHKMSQKFYVSDPGNEFTGFTNFDSKAFVIGDPFDVNKNNSTKDNNIVGAVDTGTTYCITNEYGIKVNTSISEASGTPNYRNVNAETDAVNIKETDALIKTTVTNTSFCDVNKLCIYIPIPKQGENWGNYMPADDTLEVSANLVSAIENPNSSYFSITYGTISLPSNTEKITQTLDNYTGWSDYSDAERCNYNCIRIANKANTKIPCNLTNSETKDKFIADNSYTFYSNLEYEGQKTSGMNYSIVRPFNANQYMSDTEMITIKYYDSYIGISSSEYGKLNGCVWNDTNENGIKDSNETDVQGLENWTIKLYKADDYKQNGENASVIKQCTTDNKGCYEFTKLEFPQTYSVVIINKDSEKYVFTQESNPYEIALNGSKQISNSRNALEMDSKQHEEIVDFGIQVAPVISVEPSEEVSPSPSISASPVPSEEVTPAPSESAAPSPSSTVIETTSEPDPKDDPTTVPSEEVTPAPSESASPIPSEDVTPAPSESANPIPSEEVTPAPSESANPIPSEEVTPAVNLLVLFQVRK